MEYRKLWLGLVFISVGSFAVLGVYGGRIYNEKPPIPDRVFDSRGNLLFTGQDIRDGMNVWQSIGGQELGSVWGHGAYVAPDWSADWAHREALYILDVLSHERLGLPFDRLAPSERAFLKERLRTELRTNTYDEESRNLVVSPLRARAFRSNSAYYTALFTDDPRFAEERNAYAIPENTVKDKARMAKMNAFFFWASWVCLTSRPGEDVTYTNNWPPDELVGNRLTGEHVFWSVFSFLLLILGVALLTFHYVSEREPALELPADDPFLKLSPSPSMRATRKYFWIVVSMLLAQSLFGIIVVHYGVEGSGFFGVSLDEFLPYSIARTWHVQLGIFWIATSWLAMGLFIAPALSGTEPRGQRLGVNILFVALLVVVVGSMAGEYLGIMQKFGLEANFWFGHQGYEYVDLGRFWQIMLFVGLLLWLFLMVRALLPAFSAKSESKHLLTLFLLSSVAIALFYSAGFMWGRQTNLAVAEYWRWWVVHLWVEGFFEVFATSVIAFLFERMGILPVRFATRMALFTANVYLAGGIIGTFHHLYFSGTPTGVLAVGATFSALEVVPLTLIGFEVRRNLDLARMKGWMEGFKWPIRCFVAVAFWNFVGAGLFGFMINPPVALYYMQGLNTTPVHSHTALFGVYGMLGIGLMLFVLRGLAFRLVGEGFMSRARPGRLAQATRSPERMLLSVPPVGIRAVSATRRREAESGRPVF